MGESQGGDEVRHQKFLTWPSRVEMYPAWPDPDHIVDEDIAWALSMICRYNGHTPIRWTVGQHSLLVSDLCGDGDPKERLHGLMHDASEAYVHDIISPLKKALPDYRQIEERWHQAIAFRYGLEYPQPAYVKHADKSAYTLERQWLHALGYIPRQYDWNQNQTYHKFLERLEECRGGGTERRQWQEPVGLGAVGCTGADRPRIEVRGSEVRTEELGVGYGVVAPVRGADPTCTVLVQG
jgi:hypothetical protein